MMLNIIVKDKRKRLNKLNLNIDELKAKCEKEAPPKDFYRCLKGGRISIIGEIKKASPSKGIIRADFPYLEIAREYEGTVEAVSVLTEEDHFKGSMDYLSETSKEIVTPTLCKDFIFTEEQVYLARASGASTILLIVRILEQELLERLLAIARSLKMEPLVETHTSEEVKRALKAGAKIIGINNRDLSNFTVDINKSIEISKDIPKEVVVVSESGIKTREDVTRLEEAGIDAILVGEAFMKSSDIVGAVRELRGDTTEIKICGIKSEREVDILNKTKPHYTGFIFAKSKRKVDKNTAMLLRSKLHPSIKAVGVFVDETYENIVKIARHCRLDVVQLHGGEGSDLCSQLRELNEFKVWKALPGESVTKYIINNYSRSTDSLLFDSVNSGGGETFDWDRLKEKNHMILAGGLDRYNIGEALTKVAPKIVDVSSGVEGADGKDYNKILKFIEGVRKHG